MIQPVHTRTPLNIHIKVHQQCHTLREHSKRVKELKRERDSEKSNELLIFMYTYIEKNSGSMRLYKISMLLMDMKKYLLSLYWIVYVFRFPQKKIQSSNCVYDRWCVRRMMSVWEWERIPERMTKFEEPFAYIYVPDRPKTHIVRIAHFLVNIQLYTEQWIHESPSSLHTLSYSRCRPYSNNNNNNAHTRVFFCSLVIIIFIHNSFYSRASTFVDWFVFFFSSLSLSVFWQ